MQSLHYQVFMLLFIHYLLPQINAWLISLITYWNDSRLIYFSYVPFNLNKILRSTSEFRPGLPDKCKPIKLLLSLIGLINFTIISDVSPILQINLNEIACHFLISRAKNLLHSSHAQIY